MLKLSVLNIRPCKKQKIGSKENSLEVQCLNSMLSLAVMVLCLLGDLLTTGASYYWNCLDDGTMTRALLDLLTTGARWNCLLDGTMTRVLLELLTTGARCHRNCLVHGTMTQVLPDLMTIAEQKSWYSRTKLDSHCLDWYNFHPGIFFVVLDKMEAVLWKYRQYKYIKNN